MFLQIAVVAIAAVSPSVSTSNSVSLPEAPMAIAASQIQVKKHNFNKLDYVLYSGVVAYRVGDYFTTERGLAHGGHEQELPKGLVENKPAFVAYSIGMAAAQIGGSIYLHKHGHAKLARIVDSIAIGAGVTTDIMNVAAVK